MRMICESFQQVTPVPGRSLKGRVSTAPCGVLVNKRDDTMSARTIDIQKERTDLGELLSLIAEGTEVLLTEGDTPVARLVPIGRRVAGLHAGAIWTSEDFDEPLPEAFWTGNP